MKKIKAYLDLVLLFTVTMVNATAVVMFIIDYWPNKLTMKFIWIGLILLTFFALMLWFSFDTFKKYLKSGFLTDNRQKVGIMEATNNKFIVFDIKTCEVIEGSMFPTRIGCMNFILINSNLYRLVGN